MATVVLSREEKGRRIAEQPNQIQQIDERFYKVASQSADKMYDVVHRENGSWICNCLDFHYRSSESGNRQIVRCKHVIACQIQREMREKVRENLVIQPLSPNVCPNCAATNLVKHGLRHNSYGDLQRFTCKACGKRFTQNLGFERMKANSRAITSAMQLYFTGESLRNVQKLLRLQGVEVSHVAIYKWIRKYVRLMEKYLEQIQPQVSNTWRADELYLKVHGNMKYLYCLLDDQTRFWIAQEVADTKYTADVRPLFAKGKIIAGKSPKTLITDGAPNFREAYKDEFWTSRLETRTEHIRDIRMDGTVHNNKMERMNGELRDREKVVRGVKKDNSPLLAGLQIYHNYVRPHMGLNGKTPADMAGIRVEGEDKWVTLIQNASKKTS